MLTAFAMPREVEPGLMDMAGVNVSAVHRTILDEDGNKVGKKFLGSPNGLPLMFAPRTKTPSGLVVAEGVQDALSGLAASAGASASHMAKLGPMVPVWVETVIVKEDQNEAGRRATRLLAEALVKRDVEVIVVEGFDHG
ncbi:MAG: hypothetical protein AAGF29_09565 [Pseudomonadota bacterium]